MASRRRGFTLVELLVVIGIISVLVAIFLPALARVREQANRVKCAANLRSIGQALTAYTQHYGYYPGARAAGPGPLFGWGFPVWTVRLRALMGGNQDVFYCPSQDERCRWVKGAAPFAKPGIPVTAAVLATAFHAGFGYEVGEWVSNDYFTPFSYGYNAQGATSKGSNRGLGGLVNGPPGIDDREVKVARVRSGSEMIAIADTVVDYYFDFYIYPLEQGQHPAKIHAGGANFLFCDGHVQWYLQKDLADVIDVSNPLKQAMRRMWNNDHNAGVY